MKTIIVNEVKNNSLVPLKSFSDSVINNFFEFIDVSPKTALTYRKALKQFILYLQNDGVKNPIREDIINFKKYLIDKGRASSTVALYLASVRRLFTWTEQAGIYPNVAVNVKSPKISREHKKDALAGSQIGDILNEIDRNSLEGLRNYAMIALISTCGLRTVEITRADVSDIRNISGTPCLFVMGKGKTDKGDFVKLTPKVEQAIREYLKARGQVNPEEPLFVSLSRRNKGQRLTTRSISGVCKTAMCKAGYNNPRLTAHSLRHSAITIALKQGMSLDDVKEFARHSSINVTMIYNHAVNRMNSMCENAISNSIFGV